MTSLLTRKGDKPADSYIPGRRHYATEAMVNNYNKVRGGVGVGNEELEIQGPEGMCEGHTLYK